MSDKMIVVFSFPAETSGVGIGMIIEKAKKLFEDKPDVKVYAAVDGPAERILNIIEGVS